MQMGKKCRKYLHSFFMSLPCTALIFVRPISIHRHCMNKNWTKGIENMVRIVVAPLGQVCLSLHRCSRISYLAKLRQLEICTEFNPNLSRNTEITIHLRPEVNCGLPQRRVSRNSCLLDDFSFCEELICRIS